MTRFELLSLLHGLGVIAWVGGGIGLLVLDWLAGRAGDHSESVIVARQSKLLGQWLFGPAWTLTLATGVALVLTENRFSFTDAWILLGFVGIVTSPLIQMTAAERGRERLTAITANSGDGDDSPRTRAAARSLSLLNTLDIAILVVVVGIMYFKPGS
jgi:uncharacterized membrane protein